jgi:glycosyltransferase involved in cell wall biosynthesis
MRYILFAKGTRNLPSARTRAWMLADYMRSTGLDAQCYHVVTRPWWQISVARIKEDWRNARLLLGARRGDTVFLQRTVHQLDFMLLVFMRRFILGRGYVFDYDDAIYLEKGAAGIKVPLILKFADTVFTSSKALKEYADRYNKHVHLVSAAFDIDNVYTRREDKQRDYVVIGWTGTPAHFENMKLVVPALTRFAAEGASIAVEILGGGDDIAALFKPIPHLRLTVHSFLPSAPIWADTKKVIPYLHNFDIGLMPLQPTEWNKGKDAWKAKEYMACGIAAAVSDWGENPLVITEGKNGVLVKDDEWYEKLKRLVDDAPYRRHVAQGGREYIEHNYSYQALTSKMLDCMASEKR